MSNVVNVGIDIQNVSLTQQGFGTPLFMCIHNYSQNRVIEVSSTQELLDMGFPEDHEAVYATHQFLRNSPSVNTVKIGRISASIPVIVTDVPDEVFNFVIHTVGIDGTNIDHVSVQASSATHTTSQVAAELGALINQDTLNGITATVVGNVVSINPEDPDLVFKVILSANIEESTPSDYESAASAFNGIRQEDDDFYFVTCAFRPYYSFNEDFCEGLAGLVEATDKLYFASTYSMGDVDPSLNPFAGRLNSWGYRNTITFFHQHAPSTTLNESYPECYFIGYNAPYLAGSVTWSNLRVALPYSTYEGKKLTTTQKALLASRNTNYVEEDAGLTVLKGGKVANGEWIDVIRGVHWLKSDFTTSLKALLFSQKGGKVPYTNVGIGRVREVCQSSLQRAVNRGFLDSYTLTLPLVHQVSTQDWQKRILSGIKFTGILSGAIHSINVMGFVTTPSNEQ